MGRRRALVELPENGTLLDRVRFAQHLESIGMAGVTLAEIQYPDAFVMLGLIASRTRWLTLETSVVQLGVRTAPSIAASAATLQEISGGRFRLGVGVSSEAIVSGWHGRTWEEPLTNAKESLALISAILAGQKSGFEGAVVRSSGFQLTDVPRHDVPIHLAGLNKAMIRTAATTADGVWLTYLPRAAAVHVADLIDSTAAGAHRTAPTKLLTTYAEVTDDVEATRMQIREQLAFYMSSDAYRRALAWHGFEEEMEDAGQAFAKRDRAAVMNAVTDELIDSIALIGAESQVRDAMEHYFDSGIDEISVAPVTRANLERTVEVVAAAGDPIEFD